MITYYHVIDAQDLKPQRFVAITFNEYVINYHSIWYFYNFVYEIQYFRTKAIKSFLEIRLFFRKNASHWLQLNFLKLKLFENGVWIWSIKVPC